MRVLCTGAAGFIGRHVTVELTHRGHDVIEADRNLSHPTYGCDLSHPRAAMLVVQRARPDVVLHLAASPGRAFCERNPWQATQDNVVATTMVAKACAANGVRLVYTSSSEVYGDHGDAVVDESSTTVPSSGVYGLTKWWGEHVCEHLAPEWLLTLRPLMVYGPTQTTGDGWAALPSFVEKAVKGQEITVHRGAERCWSYVTDVASAITDLIEGGYVGTWNVGRDDELCSMLAVARMACELAGAPRSLISVVDPPALQTVVKRVSCEALRSTGWAPRVDLVTGMRLVYESMVGELSTADRPG